MYLCADSRVFAVTALKAFSFSFTWADGCLLKCSLALAGFLSLSEQGELKEAFGRVEFLPWQEKLEISTNKHMHL